VITNSGYGLAAMTPMVKRLIFITCGVFLAQLIAPVLTAVFALHPPAVLRLEAWRLLTYVFLHGSLGHLLLNMLVLYMFGGPLEGIWGSRRFLRYYLLCGVGAGLFTLLPIPAFFHASHIGASGAAYGLLLAFGLLFPDTRVFVFFVLPMRASHLVVALGFISLASSLSATSDGVSHIAHLGGLVAGYLLLIRMRLLMGRPDPLRNLWGRLALRRRRARFDRYEREFRNRRDTVH